MTFHHSRLPWLWHSRLSYVYTAGLQASAQLSGPACLDSLSASASVSFSRHIHKVDCLDAFAWRLDLMPPCCLMLLPLAHMCVHCVCHLCMSPSVCKQMYIGSGMVVCVADPAVAKRMLTKLMTRFTGIPLLAGEQDWEFLGSGLVGTK